MSNNNFNKVYKMVLYMTTAIIEREENEKEW